MTDAGRKQNDLVDAVTTDLADEQPALQALVRVPRRKEPLLLSLRKHTDKIADMICCIHKISNTRSYDIRNMCIKCD